MNSPSYAGSKVKGLQETLLGNTLEPANRKTPALAHSMSQ
jgi:hypothetical protein